MRRFSQRSALVTLSEINITPLLEKGLELKLPNVQGQADQVRQEDIRTVEITRQGSYALKGQAMKLDQIERELVKDHQYNKNLVVYIRADGDSLTKQVAALIDRCQRSGITRYSLRTQPLDQR